MVLLRSEYPVTIHPLENSSTGEVGRDVPTPCSSLYNYGWVGDRVSSDEKPRQKRRDSDGIIIEVRFKGLHPSTETLFT